MSRDRLKRIAFALAALIVLWGAVEILRGGFDEVTGDFAIPVVAQADADSVVFERAADTVVLAKQGEEWTVNGHLRPRRPDARLPERGQRDVAGDRSGSC